MNKLFLDIHPAYDYATPIGKVIANKIWQRKTLYSILYLDRTRKKFLWSLGIHFTPTANGYECKLLSKNKRKIKYKTNMSIGAIERWHILKDFQHILGLKNIHIRNIFLSSTVRNEFERILSKEYILYQGFVRERETDRVQLISEFVKSYKSLIYQHNKITGRYRRNKKSTI